MKLQTAKYFLLLAPLIIAACSSTHLQNKGARHPASFRIDEMSASPCQLLDNDGDDPREKQQLLKMQRACEEHAELFDMSAEGAVYPYLHELSPSLSLELEKQFDAFILVNTALANNDGLPYVHGENLGVPSQFVRVLVKKHRNAQDTIFQRDPSGRFIIGIDEDKADFQVPQLAGLLQIPNELATAAPALVLPSAYAIPTSTGLNTENPEDMLTFGGLFRINVARSRARFSPRIAADMSFQTYIQHYYRGGQESGIALHGTPPARWHWLGSVRHSHGCARTFPEYAQIVRNFVMSLPQRELPNLAWHSWRGQSVENPQDPVQQGIARAQAIAAAAARRQQAAAVAAAAQNPTAPAPAAVIAPQPVTSSVGPPVLFVVFNGYEPVAGATNAQLSIPTERSNKASQTLTVAKH